MRNWDIRAREGREFGCSGAGGGRVNICISGSFLEGWYARKRYEVE